MCIMKSQPFLKAVYGGFGVAVYVHSLCLLLPHSKFFFEKRNACKEISCMHLCVK